MSKIKTLKPLDFGNVLTTEEALAQLEGYVPEKSPQDDGRTPTTSPQPPGNIPGSENVSGIYNLVSGDTYALGVHALREACVNDPNSAQLLFTKDDGSEIYRPLTFKETIRARVDDFNTSVAENGEERSLDERLKLYAHYIDSCTSIAYKAETTKFKVIPVCKKLITIDSSFNENFLPVDYDTLSGVELDSSNEKYDQSLTKQEIENHSGWRTALEDDLDLLKEYRNIVFEALKDSEGNQPEKAMGFYVMGNTAQAQLRALFVDYLNSNSNAGGSVSLYDSGSFLQVAPSKTP